MDTADRVQQAAVRLFAERGYHGVGIRDLAQEAGLSSASLYHYMGTKQDLLAAVMRASLERLLVEGVAAVASAGEPVGQLRALVRMHVREHADRRLQTLVVDGELRALEQPQRAEVVALRDRYESLWADVIDRGAAAGDFRAPDPALARLALLEMCTGVARWYAADGRVGLEELTERYVELALAMLGAPGRQS